MDTKTTRVVLAAAMLLGVALACGLPATGPQTPAPVATTAVSATPAQPGIPVASAGISFTIPAGLAGGATPENVASMDNEPVPAWELAPAFTQFTLENYQVSGALLKPMVYIYPALKYAGDNSGAAESMRRLRALLSGGGKNVKLQNAPFVPSFNATQTFVARAMPLKFENGTGLRMLTQYDQAPIPVNNHELIYHFEGLSGDGIWYVIAVFPVHAAGLPADGNPASPVPTGGLTFTPDDPQAYFEKVAAQLDAAPDGSFSPSLDSLDTLVKSLKIVAP